MQSQSQKKNFNESISQQIPLRQDQIDNKNQSIISSQKSNDKNKDVASLMKRYRRIRICSFICILIFIFVAAGFPPIIKSLIKSTAQNQAILNSDNEGLWAHIPGDSNVDILRNFTFFNLQNEYDVLLKNHKPSFREISNFDILEREDYLNISYQDDGNLVKFIDWLHFSPHPKSRSMDEKVKVLNLGGIGYWSSLKVARPTLILQQGLAQLFVSLQTDIISTALAEGIKSQYLSSDSLTINILLNPAGVSLDKSLKILNDINYGLNNNLKIWVSATETSFNSDGILTYSQGALELKDYFFFTDTQLFYLLNEFNTYIDSLKGILFTNFYCTNIDICTGRQLAIRQLASSFVTNNTPPAGNVSSTDTICRDNITCKGFFPQISAYFNNVYSKQQSTITNITFDHEIVRRWFDYNNTKTSKLHRVKNNKEQIYSIHQSLLLHIGNLDALWANGTAYDKDKSHEEYLGKIMKRFQLPSINHTKVFWKWIKYLTYQFVKQNSSNQEIGMSSLFANGLYQGFSYLKDNLQNYMLKKIINSKRQGINCTTFIKNSINTSQSMTAVICEYYKSYYEQQQFILTLMKICRNKQGQQWQQLHGLGLKLVEMQILCDPIAINNISFGQMYHDSRVHLKNLYLCNQFDGQYCSDYQLAIKQWTQSSITRSPPKQILNSSTTFASWDSKAQQFEYYHFYQLKYQTAPNITIQQAQKWLNFDNWFSSSSVLKQLLTNPQQKQYFRYVSIKCGLNGFTTVRTVQQLIQGYNDELLIQISNLYPPFGGDPSTKTLIALNDPNITSEQATLSSTLYTGKNQSLLVALYNSINNLSYLSNNFSHFNGNETYSQLSTPWQVNDYFYGTSGKQFAPNQFDNDNISLYIDSIQRYGGPGQSDKQDITRYGYDLLQAYLGQSILQEQSVDPNNKKYYQSYYAIFNETSVLGLPLFLSKNHFMSCKESWLSLIDIWDQSKSIKYTQTSHWDDSFVIVEPYSGIAFEATIYLQTNYYFEQDVLFNLSSNKMLLPIFTVYRSGNLTEQKTDDLLGGIKKGMAVKTAMLIIGIVFSVLSFIVLVFFWFKLHKLQKQHLRDKESLLSNFNETEIQNKQKQIPQKISILTQKQDAPEKQQQQNQ